MSWSRHLSEKIDLADGSVLATLAEARAFVLAIPEPAAQHTKWQNIVGVLLSAARSGREDLIRIATDQLKRAFDTPPFPHVGLAPAKKKSAPQRAR
jgi:hypothetical protein